MAKILIADDDAHIVRVLFMWLGRHGHQVVTAMNGEDALATLDRELRDAGARPAAARHVIGRTVFCAESACESR